MFLLRQLFRMRESMQISPPDQAEMPFLDHLEDLRLTIIRMAATVVIAMAACFGFAPSVMSLLRMPVDRVWEDYEARHLPYGVSTQDWLSAKTLASVRHDLSPAATEVLKARTAPDTWKLAELVPLLRAAEVLPPGHREDFLRASLPGDDALPLLLALHESGAVLREAQGREALKLMGAFQPGEAFLLSLQISFFGGILLSAPLLMYYLLRFIVPGLLEHERALLYRCIAAGSGLFLGGCAFAYFLVLPRVLSFFYSYSLDMGIENDWRIGYYLTFAAKLVFVFGIIFELPVIVMPLVKLGILSYPLMKRTRPYALVACFAVALLLSPAPDPGTMLIMALPMYMLYEACILYARFQEKRRQQEEAEAEEA